MWMYEEWEKIDVGIDINPLVIERMPKAWAPVQERKGRATQYWASFV